MNDDMLGRFLNGEANEEEFKQCETLLEDGNTVVEQHQLENADSLVAALRTGPTALAVKQEDTGDLVQRIEGFASRQSIGREDLERLLDDPQEPDEIGRIGKYRIIEFIAAGGMGLVFKAEDAELNRLVCIKIMHPALALKPDAKLRFQRESRAAAQLRSERIVTLLDIGVQRDLPYIVMQLLDGESLRAKLSREGKLTPKVAVRYVSQMAEGLRHAHAMDILHRDIKSDNIWVTPEDDIKLLDFGLARPLDEAGNLTTTGGLIGTPQYMSPEQIQGQTLDERSDLFSLGVVLFEMLAGTLPFQKNNLFSTMIAITNDSVNLPASEFASEIEPELEVILHSLLKKSAKERIQSANDLIEQLSQLTSPGSNSASSVSPRPKLSGAKGSSISFGRLPYVLGGLFGGLCAMMLGILVMQTTDKGTLVVQTDDPQVEVQIAQDKITIKDPLSGRRFEVQIGKTTLPGGVYQLELNDATSGLTFSSSTVAIRRGETVIVKAELQPAPQVAASKSTDKDAAATLDNKQPIEVDKNADPSFDAKAREGFAGVLERLPALTVDSNAAAIVGADATLVAQQKLPSIDSWSIDTNHVTRDRFSRNSDGTLFAAHQSNSVQIWDKSLNLKYTLPLRGIVRFEQFDNKFPNLIAVSCYTKSPGDLVSSDELSIELTVWRLGADYAEVIYRIPCSQYRFAWDQGYRLVYANQNGAAAFRLDQGKAYDLPGPDGMIIENGVSTSGRYLATHNNQNIDIWDLKRGEFAFTALSTHRAQWNQQGDRVAFFTSLRPAFEIWDLDNRSIADKVELPVEPLSSDRTGTRMTMSAVGLEPTFQRVAWLTPQGTLNVRNLQTNREDSMPLPRESKTTIREAALKWEGNSFVVETDEAAFVWTHQKSDVQGILNEREPSPLSQKKQDVELDFSRASGSNSPALCWYDVGAFERNRAKLVNARDWENQFYFDAFDIGSNKFFRDVPLGQLRESLFSNSRVIDKILGPPFFSLDGRYATGPTLDVSNGATNGRDEVWLYNLMSPEPPTKIKAGGAATVWNKTSRFAFMIETDFSQPKVGFKIYDAIENQFIEEQNFAQAVGKIVDLQTCNNGFLVCLRTDQQPPQAGTRKSNQPMAKYSGELHVWIIDPDLKQVKELPAAAKLLTKVVPVESIYATDHYVFVKSLGQVDSVEDPAKIRKVYRIAIDDQLGSQVQCITVPVVDELLFSASGEYMFREARNAEVVAVTSSQFGIMRNIKSNGPSELFVARWSDVARDLGDVDALEVQTPSTQDWATLTEFKQNLGRLGNPVDPKWHPQVDVFAWSSNGYPHFFAADKRELRMDLTVTGRDLVASDQGWTKADRNEVHFFDPKGQPVGRLIFDPYMSDHKPTNPRWILADGSMAMQCSTDGLAISFLKNNRFYCESVDEFEKSRPDVKLPRAKHISGLETAK